MTVLLILLACYLIPLVLCLVTNAVEFIIYDRRFFKGPLTIGDWWFWRKDEIVMLFIPIFNIVILLSWIWWQIWTNFIRKIKIFKGDK